MTLPPLLLRTFFWEWGTPTILNSLRWTTWKHQSSHQENSGTKRLFSLAENSAVKNNTMKNIFVSDTQRMQNIIMDCFGLGGRCQGLEYKRKKTVCLTLAPCGCSHNLPVTQFSCSGNSKTRLFLQGPETSQAGKSQPCKSLKGDALSIADRKKQNNITSLQPVQKK